MQKICRGNSGVQVRKIYLDWQLSTYNEKECVYCLRVTSLFICLIFNIRFSSSIINGKQCKLRKVQQ